MSENPQSNYAWEDRLTWFKSSSQYRALDTIDGEPIEFEWNILPGFTTLQLCNIVTKGRFTRDEWNHLQCLFNIMCFATYSGSHLKSTFSQTRERLVIGAMSKRGQDTTSSDGSPTAKARPTNLVLQGQCKEGVSSQGSGSPVNQVNEYNRKRVCLAAGNRCSSSSNAEVGSSQVYRQEMVNLAARRLGQKDLTRPKSEEDSPSTGQPVAVSPEMENMRFSNYSYVEKIFQCIQKKLRRT